MSHSDLTGTPVYRLACDRVRRRCDEVAVRGWRSGVRVSLRMVGRACASVRPESHFGNAASAASVYVRLFRMGFVAVQFLRTCSTSLRVAADTESPAIIAESSSSETR